MFVKIKTAIEWLQHQISGCP